MAADEEDEDVGSVPSHPSQIADEEDDDYLDENDRAYTEPVIPTMSDV